MLLSPKKSGGVPALSYISLFSGIGGIDLGFDRAGMRCLAQVEWDKRARAVLDYHWPDVPKMEDVRNVGRHNLPAAPDVLCGGFPCQDVSVAGRRAGLAGQRSGLWFEFLRLVTELTPRWVVIENVPGLLSSNSGRDFATILHGLVSSGYRVGWRVLDAQYWGVAQRRQRVFIVASSTAAGGNPAEVLFERESGAGDFKPRRATGQGTTTYAIKGAAIGRQPENSPQRGEIAADGSCYTLNATEVHAIYDTSFKRRGGYGWSEFKEVVGTLESESGSHQGGVERIPYITSAFVPVAFQPNASRHDGMPVLDNLAPSMRTDPLAGQQAAWGVRRLTPLECERLQGFPDHWTAANGQSDGRRYKQLGNAVCVNVAEWIGRRIAAV